MLKQLLFVVVATGSAMSQAQTIFYEGRLVDFGSDRPYTSQGVAMVPARHTADIIRGTLDRDDSGRHITIRWRNNRADYTKGQTQFDLNGRRAGLGASSEERRGVLYVPLELFRSLTDGRMELKNNLYDKDRPNPPGNWNPGHNPPPTRPGYNNPQQISFDGRWLTFDAREMPYRRNGELMVPFRALGDRIGARTDRTSNGRTVTLTLDRNRIEYEQGRNTYLFNNQVRRLKSTSEERDGILFVPSILFEDLAGRRIRTTW